MKWSCGGRTPVPRVVWVQPREAGPGGMGGGSPHWDLHRCPLQQKTPGPRRARGHHGADRVWLTEIKVSRENIKKASFLHPVSADRFVAHRSLPFSASGSPFPSARRR